MTSKALSPQSWVKHYDAQGEWLEVPYQAVQLLDLESSITPISYMKGDLVYLDDLADTPVFVRTWKSMVAGLCAPLTKAFAPVPIAWDDNVSFIRDLPPYRPRR